MTEMLWYKRFHGTAYDPKFTAAGVEAGSSHCNALGVWDALLETTSEQEEDRGSLANIDLRIVAAGLHLALDEVRRIWSAFVDLGMIEGQRVAKWAKRQGARVAAAAEAVSAAALRTRRWRQKKARDPRQREMLFEISGGAAETPAKASAGASPRPSRASHPVTPPSPDAAESDPDLPLSDESDVRARARRSFAEGDFKEFWEGYPHKVDEKAARTAFAAAMRTGADLAEILAGLERYRAAKPRDREWMNPATFLQRQRWRDRPAATLVEAPAEPQRPTAPPAPPSAEMIRLAQERMRLLLGEDRRRAA
jgi:hypothetical protein